VMLRMISEAGGRGGAGWGNRGRGRVVVREGRCAAGR
jgi:hypothetical protein